ncbi:hypothetical protein ACFOPQ_19815 [Deinococcus antarcticus]|uniref:Uncharacterized protein n=1 Tax=Deinococcus antarcticus TaxID=1298767 RepID=A0ABV8AC04_9DEIO
MSNEHWYRALSYLPSRFHTASGPADLLRLAFVKPPMPQAPLGGPAAPTPAVVVPAPTPEEVQLVFGQTPVAPVSEAAPEGSGLSVTVSPLTEMPPVEYVPDEVLDACADLYWMDDYVMSDLPPLNVSHPDLPMPPGGAAISTTPVTATPPATDPDPLHLPDFVPTHQDPSEALLASLRGKGQDAIRHGLQSYLN